MIVTTCFCGVANREALGPSDGPGCAFQSSNVPRAESPTSANCKSVCFSCKPTTLANGFGTADYYFFSVAVVSDCCAAGEALNHAGGGRQTFTWCDANSQTDGYTIADVNAACGNYAGTVVKKVSDFSGIYCVSVKWQHDRAIN